MALGSYNPDNVKAELFDFGTCAWKTVDDYPFTSRSRVSSHDMVYIPETNWFIVIGGADGHNELSQIAKFEHDKWSGAGRLKYARKVIFRLLMFVFNFLIQVHNKTNSNEFLRIKSPSP